jgi:hypothetical protein
MKGVSQNNDNKRADGIQGGRVFVAICWELIPQRVQFTGKAIRKKNRQFRGGLSTIDIHHHDDE